MDSSTRNSFSSKIQLLLDSEVEFKQKLKQHLVFKSDQVSNPFRFIRGLLSKGILSDESDDSEATFGLKEMMVRLAMMIGCAKGAGGIGGLVEALKESGNSELISAFRAWIKQDFGTEIECNFDQPKTKEADSAAAQTKNSEALVAQARKFNELSSCGAKLVDKIMARVDDHLTEQLQGHFIGSASEIVNATEFCSSFVNLKVLDENGIKLATAPENKEAQRTEKLIKAACVKKQIGSLVVAFQSSKNERILTETCEWLETCYLRKKNYPISAKSLARQQRNTATGIFATTNNGLISVDLRTLKATALTRGITCAVAVNHNLKKVYWSEGQPNFSISRSNFDGSAREIIVPKSGGIILALAIDEASGNLYFSLFDSHEIQVCNVLGKNRAVVISSSSLVNRLIGIALDSENGFMYWGNRGSSLHSVVRANLDGSNSTIISAVFQNLLGITLDQPANGVLYWSDDDTDTIGTIDLKDGKKRTLVDLEDDGGLRGIQVDDHKIYFSTYGSKNVVSVDRNSGERLTTIYKSKETVWRLALFNVPVTRP